ncbi:major facilitator superfamily domain-containing protein [Xylariomycetidae sp. FL2044]|nr:major facilitator superfamily domain-containing protein [Xylariomycetidae sp. FL2044]
MSAAPHGPRASHEPTVCRSAVDDVESVTDKQAEEGGDEEPERAFTSFSKIQLRHLQILLGVATITSPLTATIYFPLLPLLRTYFNTSAQAINLTLTIYIIFQALSPAIFGPLSDAYGRRPFFLLTLLLYIVANFGLSLNKDNYVALLILRAIQSLGASAAYSISFGVVADVCGPSDRGRMLGPIGMALNLGACVGPVVGGVVAFTSGSIIWVFWSLVIVGALLLGLVGMFLPETARNIVGNGSDKSRFCWWQLSWLGLIQRVRESGAGGCRGASEAIETVPPQRDGITNIFACFRIIFYKDTFLTLWIHGSFYVVDYAFVAALADIYKDQYHFNEIGVGLAYLPRGVGIIIGSYFTGKLMDMNYRTTVKEMGLTINKVTADDVFRFPIEKARSRHSFSMLGISTVTMVAYGWASQFSAPFAILLVLQLMQGFWGTFFYTTYSALLVDSFPQSPSTASAATSMTRCAMAASGVAALQPLMSRAGRGWFFTVLGLWSGISGAAAILTLRSKGMIWRSKRRVPT